MAAGASPAAVAADPAAVQQGATQRSEGAAAVAAVPVGCAADSRIKKPIKPL